MNNFKYYMLIFFTSLLFSGCSVQLYSAPEINIKLIDSNTKEPIENVKLSSEFGDMITTSNTSGNLLIESQPISANLSREIQSEKRWYDYLFQIISDAETYPSFSYILSHKDYNSYSFRCYGPASNPSCSPTLYKIITQNTDKKDFLCEKGCSISKNPASIKK